ncbi:hypothetical protein CONLIGDRAFT_406849 [Coniochaeta ligniaria NRRL 30616]|uniref:Uncharacterized protein n=1 Tax=Coniochaeta ligniaria NRRL 30616 TaxID=1408157 RepID=A0A1J7INK6_9PEZI|nr:hypothetical protein CONLIGDRAFT_406849 [Coniochaeta ligniaria NRRL 30616]
MPILNGQGPSFVPPTPPSTTDNSVVSSDLTENLVVVARSPAPDCEILKAPPPEDVIEATARAKGDIVICLGVDINNYVQIIKKRGPDTVKFRVRRYSLRTGTLELAVLTPLHESLHVQLKRQVVNAVVAFPDSESRLSPLVGQPVDVPRLYWRNPPAPGFPQGNSQDALEADASASPLNPCPYLGLGGTLVILPGVTQVLAELRQYAKVWLNAPGLKKLVLLVTACPKDRVILIEKWSQGSLSPSLPHQRTLVADQWISISPKEGGFSVTGGPLELDFRTLFLRRPTPGQGDSIVIDDNMLKEYATSVWNEVGNFPTASTTFARPRPN